MAGGSRFAAIAPEGQLPAAADIDTEAAASLPPLALDAPADAGWSDSGQWSPQAEQADGSERIRSAGWLAPVLAIVTMAAWTGVFIWANLDAITLRPNPALFIELVGKWSGPALLICVVWLLFMRTSRRETLRFADAALALGQESALLEQRLATVNRELSLAREFLAAQGRDLDALGRVAVDRLSQHGERLASLVQDNSAQIDAIGTVSTAALENMERLRSQLPVIASSAKDVTNNIANSGRVAHAHLQSMVTGLGRLNEFGQASERHVASMREQIDDALGAAEARSQQLDASLTARMTLLAERSAGFRAELDALEAAIDGAMRERAAALSSEISSTRSKLEEDEAQGLVSLRARMASLHSESTNIVRALRDGEAVATANWQAKVTQLTTEIAKLDSEIARRHASISAKTEALGVATAGAMGRFTAIDERLATITTSEEGLAATLAARLDMLAQSLGETESHIARLTDSSVRLLELIQSSAQHSREQLPRAIALGEERLTSYETRVVALRDAVVQANSLGETLSEQMLNTTGRVATATANIGQLHNGLEARARSHGEVLAALGQSLGQMEADTLRLAAKAQGELASAIEQLSGAARDAVVDIESHSAQGIAQLAQRLSSESGAAIERALRLQTAEMAGQLEQSAAHAAGVSRDAAVQFRNQLAKVDELVGNLERRVAQARERAEEKVDNDFARRVALITESLNSAAIDIARVFDSDVTDTAWAAYLRGDRGIFTRRAVRLLDASQVKAVMRIYEDDRNFSDHVNQYIHDFEAMLRQLLSTRDGHALGVTLLSSDMGKLYVALAQAIERLRN